MFLFCRTPLNGGCSQENFPLVKLLGSNLDFRCLDLGCRMTAAPS